MESSFQKLWGEYPILCVTFVLVSPPLFLVLAFFPLFQSQLKQEVLSSSVHQAMEIRCKWNHRISSHASRKKNTRQQAADAKVFYLRFMVKVSKSIDITIQVTDKNIEILYLCLRERINSDKCKEREFLTDERRLNETSQVCVIKAAEVLLPVVGRWSSQLPLCDDCWNGWKGLPSVIPFNWGQYCWMA